MLKIDKHITTLLLLQKYAKIQEKKTAYSFEELEKIIIDHDYKTKKEISLTKKFDITFQDYWKAIIILKNILESKKGIKLKINDPNPKTPVCEAEKSIKEIEKERLINLVAELIEEEYEIKVNKNDLEIDNKNAWIKGAVDPDTGEILDQTKFFKDIVMLAKEIIKDQSKIEELTPEEYEESYFPDDLDFETKESLEKSIELLIDNFFDELDNNDENTDDIPY